MYEVNQEPAGEQFRGAWRAAGRHLQRRGEGGISWLRADLAPPLAEHLSFRLGNQLFFVFIEVRGEGNGPSSKELFLRNAAEATALPVVLLMESVGGDFQPVHGEWGLRDARTDRTIDPPALVSSELIEMSDWEVHDFAIQIVASQIAKSAGSVLSKQPSLQMDPSVWFRDKDGPAYVVVRSARFPVTEAQRPANRTAIMASCATLSRRGYFASVAVANAEQQTPPASEGAVPLYRGHGMVVRFDGLEPL
jgi:hypothetical protein